jgi:hypothetical protein
MRRIVVLTLAATAAAACGGPSRSDVIVDWTFEGQSCADVGVETIQFDIAGEVLSPNQFSCSDAPVGVDFGTFLVGDYQITVTGFDGASVPTHQIVQTLQVRGNHGGRDEFAIDVPRVADSTTALLTWTFSPGGDCATANVQQVRIFVDPSPDGTGGTDAGTVACSTMGTQGASVAPLTPGTHTFAISGLRVLSDGPHLVYRTHTPVSAFFQQSAITDVAVPAESPP